MLVLSIIYLFIGVCFAAHVFNAFEFRYKRFNILIRTLIFFGICFFWLPLGIISVIKGD